ncbi:MAG: CpsD/CapB family tyrosine-protein kinase [Actinomycetota bacterium]
MEPTYYLRVLRMRWKVLILGAFLGAAVAAASLVVAGDGEEVETTYWLGKHQLIISDEAISSGRFPNLLQTALLVTGGDAPAEVSAAVGIDEVTAASRVRTVTNLDVNVLEISTVATSADEAALLADAFAAVLVDRLDERDREAYADALVLAQEDVDSEDQRLAALDEQIAEIEGALAAHDAAVAEALSDEDPATNGPERSVRDALAAELRSVDLEREGRSSIYDTALERLTELERSGAPAPLLETLDVIPPFQISERLFSVRVRQGRQGANHFNARTVDDGDTGGISLGQTVSNPTVRVGLGLVGGLLAAIGAVLVHLRFDQRIRTKAEAEEAFDLPVLAEIPKFSARDSKPNELHALTRSRSVVAESYRVIRSALLFAKATRAEPLTSSTVGPDIEVTSDVRVIMVTSPGPSEGKTTTTANLAVLLAEAGYRVLVANCDYRLPRLHLYFDQPHSHRKTVETGIPNVTLVADVADEAVTRNPTQVVETQKNLIRKAREHYDVVLLDTAPLLATNDALALLPAVDMVLLVAQEGKTDADSAAEAVDLLRRRRADIAGVVFTATTGFGRSRHYYKYRYGAYYNDATTTEETVIDASHADRQARLGAATSAARNSTN